MSPTRVCLVTDELYPFTAGGIGRLTHNLIVDSLRRTEDVEFHVLVPATVPLQPAQVEVYFGNRVKLHVCRYREPQQGAADAHGIYPPLSAFRDTRWHGESLEFMRYLKAREQEGLRFDVVEFIDFHGWAFCSLQEKRLGLAFAQTTLSVRLHSTSGILMPLEPNTLEVENLGRYEIERKALFDADVVVAHLPCIASINQRFYGFDEQWLRKVRVEFPPVVVDAAPVPAPPIPATQRNLVFITKIQPLKHPDVFVRAAVLLMRGWPEYAGKAVLACHSFDSSYLAEIKGLVPTDLMDRFVFMKPGPDRDVLMRSGVVAITSRFESLNLTAYESSVAGGRLVLNAECAAFGDDSPFVDGVNCHKYDGTVDGLAATLRKALEAPGLEPVKWTVSTPYWETQAPVAAHAASTRTPLVSVIILNQDRGRSLPEALRSVAASTYLEVEVIVVDDASTGGFDLQVLTRLEQSAATTQDLRVIRSPVRRGLSGARNLGLRAARGEYVLSLDSDGCLAPGFIQYAVAALEAQPAFSGVAPTSGRFHGAEDLAERRFADFDVYLGDCPSLSLVADRVSSHAALLRKSLFEKHGYDEALLSHEDWGLFVRWVQGGHRFLVTNQAQVFTRRSERPPLTDAERRRFFQRLVGIFDGMQGPLHPSVRVFSLLAHSRDAMVDLFSTLHAPAPALNAVAPVEVAQAMSAAMRPLRYDVVDWMNAAVKRLPGVHPLLKQVAGATAVGSGPGDSAEGGGGSPLRYALVDRVNGLFKRAPLVHSALRWTISKVS
ncbi:glycosyltransferase [Myxococcus virescens]|uniref:Glycosyltransferase involved in cell wall bisynthesis n=1 Tax=Myxococcus virescens TaxID=83456 RepID=A0A511HDK2_9BACT|nr:glycosyltransferase [Myxococcus virescens]GEL71623.1 hypothetical protein MVI01_34070 [Myxococcus virescens]SDF00307.1 Glycosyltransferase involved in cell wall bisynthesis [Myxococcus virescens]